MNTRYKIDMNHIGQEMKLVNKTYFILLVFTLLMPFNTLQPVYAQRPDAADLSLVISPDSVATGDNVQMSSDVLANMKIKVGMLIYRLTGPGGNVHYLEPIILRDFESGNSYHFDTDYQVVNNTGVWMVEAYLCLGQCAIKGQEPPKNAAVTATGEFTVINEPAPLPTPGPLSFP